MPNVRERFPGRRDKDSAAARFRAVKTAAALSLSLSLISPAALAQGTPDVVFTNGHIVTLDASDSVATAVAVKDGRFLAVGGDAAILALAGTGTRRVDLGGRTAVPGLIDGHAHPMETIYLKEDWVDARFPGTPSVREALARIAARAQSVPKGEWIFVACVSASQNKFAEKRIPTRAELDEVAPDNPVTLANGTHMAVVNSAALARLGVTKGVRRLAKGGSVLLDENGEPTGVLTDAQADIPANPAAAELEHYYATGIQEFWNRYGFTSVLAITPASALPVLRAASLRPAPPNLRYTVSVWASADGGGLPDNLDAFAMPEGADPAYYRYVGIKAWVDGENDCRTGYMYEPYRGHFDTDPPGNRGILVMPPDAVERFARTAARAGKIAMLHCSGDAATDIALDAYGKTAQTTGAGPLQRIEHFGMFQLTDTQLRRARSMVDRGLRISVQPTWLVSLAEANVENMGEAQARTGFRFRSMIEAGLEPAAGTDMTGIYLENIDPMRAIHASVTRMTGAGPFVPEEAISVKDALRMWTIWAARAMDEGNVKGSIETGKYADMTVLSDDIFAIPPERLASVRVLRTIVGGRTVFEAAP